MIDVFPDELDVDAAAAAELRERLGEGDEVATAVLVRALEALRLGDRWPEALSCATTELPGVAWYVN